MNRTELFTEVKSWLEAGKFAFVSEDDSVFRFRINADNGLFDVRVLCEDRPPMLQVCCPVPVRIPKGKVAQTGLLLHNINARLRIGAFQFHVDERVVDFRMTLPIQPEGELAEQFALAVGTTISTMDDHVHTLGLLACCTPEARKSVAKLSPASRAGDESSRPHAKRFDLN
jgi:hypothetical protein